MSAGAERRARAVALASPRAVTLASLRDVGLASLRDVGLASLRPVALASLRAVTIASLLAACGCGRIVILHDPLTAAEHHDLGVAYESAGRLDLAAREYQRALRLDPDLGRAWLNLGNVEAAEKRWDRAARRYRRALAAMPGDPDPPNNLAIALVRLGRDDAEAESLAVRAVALAAGRDSLYRATLAEVRAARAGRAPRRR